MQISQELHDTLETLSRGSVDKHFDPFVDIDWDHPDFQVDPADKRWILPADHDPLGATDWYRELPESDQIRIGIWRAAYIMKIGSIFEMILIRGMIQYIQNLPNDSVVFRYAMHEMTEECHHIQMFQQGVNRLGQPSLRLPFHLKLASFVASNGGLFPTVFFIGVLAGEEPIDHFQKAMSREHCDNPPLLQRIMQIHIAEEARHISFAHEFLKERVADMNAIEKFATSLVMPVVMRYLAGVIMKPYKAESDRMGIPKDVRRQVFWRSPASARMLAGYFSDVRMLADQLALRNPISNLLWRKLGISGSVSRYRSDPYHEARGVTYP